MSTVWPRKWPVWQFDYFAINHKAFTFALHTAGTAANSSQGLLASYIHGGRETFDNLLVELLLLTGFSNGVVMLVSVVTIYYIVFAVSPLLLRSPSPFNDVKVGWNATRLFRVRSLRKEIDTNPIKGDMWKWPGMDLEKSDYRSNTGNTFDLGQFSLQCEPESLKGKLDTGAL